MSPPCRFFHSTGGCRNGANCRFSHTTDVDAGTSSSTSRPSTPTRGTWRSFPGPCSPHSTHGSEIPAGVCHFYWRQGTCPNNLECNFRHIRPDTEQEAHTSPPQTRYMNLSSDHVRQAPAPPGVCRYYWAQGRCSREFECHFRHTRTDTCTWRQEATSSPAFRSINLASGAAKEMLSPFLTSKGLSKINGIATDAFFSDNLSLSPSEAHSKLARFLKDGFEFRSTFDIYAFLVPLCSANASNASWKQEEGQLLLSSLASGNGRLRILDIIKWSDVSIQVGWQSRTSLSFQRGILPLLRYLSSEFVVKSTLTTQANHLYTILLQNLPKFADVVVSCMDAAIERKSFEDRSMANHEPFDAQIFASLAGVLHELLTRFKNAVASYAQLPGLIFNLRRWFQEWQSGITSIPPTFGDPFNKLQPNVAELIVSSIKEKIDRLAAIVEREEQKLVTGEKTEEKAKLDMNNPSEALVAALRSSYIGPGDLRDGGPRHDNDFEDISEIRILPTNDELMNRLPPFLPANLYAAPHPAPLGSMQRLLDIQFRLLREELLAPLRKAVQLVHDDLQDENDERTKLAELLKKQGGKYRGSSDGQDSLMFNVYTGVQFDALVPDWRGISAAVLLDTPPGRARSAHNETRVKFWERMSGKRLFQGSLVALVWKSGRRISVHLGVIATSSRQFADYVKLNAENIKLRIVFFDTTLELRVLEDLRKSRRNFRNNDVKILVESPVMFEAIRPFLEALQTEPEDIPFPRYLVLQPPEQLRVCQIEPPRYATLPGFEFQLSSLFSEDAGVDDLTLCVTDPASIARARTALRGSRLDPSQADAVVDTLTREVALIQGPPGTGKSFTGVEILRVFRSNKIGPILMIAFTNHALDHMLCSVLDAKITSDIIRLGRGEGRMADYSIETRETAHGYSRLDFTSRSSYRELKVIQERITELMDQILNVDAEPTSVEIVKYLSTYHPEHYAHFCNPPDWVANCVKLSTNDDDANAGNWRLARRKGRSSIQDGSVYALWRDLTDLAFIQQITSGSSPPKATSKPEKPQLQNNFSVLTVDPGEEGQSSESDSDSDSVIDDINEEESWKMVQIEIGFESSDSEDAALDHNHPSEQWITPPTTPPTEKVLDQDLLAPSHFKDMEKLLSSLGFDQKPMVPSIDRSLEELLEDVGDVWTMSTSERRRLHRHWVAETRVELRQTRMQEFESLQDKHSDAIKECNEFKEEVRRSLLHDVDIIGCTTTGAASLTTLLKGLSPKVLLVEEAGQVMEAHILGSLVPSIEHIVLIGDPLQLRPTLNNFALSMDSKRGKALYKFDMSLMERLSTSGLTMSRINEQRRMRPTISSLIRNTLYPGLEDHELVCNYPDVRGIQKNVFFMTHTHKENDGADDTASKYNTYEVDMIRDLVLYLLRQGCYSDEGDIVVLCAYLGQLARLRDALGDDVAVIIDEKDQTALDDQGSDNEEQFQDEVAVKRVSVTKRVRLRTVDNYQGEEGRIVIISLVRNAGSLDDELENRYGVRPTIGFLKSENRTNVAISRAREGLYIFGNADNLSSRSRMWHSIIEELKSIDCVGTALPISCHRHPETVEYVSQPGMLSQIAPDGGCLRSCGTRLACGHLCPFKCHCDDPSHITVICSQACGRLCIRDHPCSKPCSATCGQCRFPYANVALPCGHVKQLVECHELEDLDHIFCDFQMEKKLPNCEHTATMACGQAPSSEFCCLARCNVLMACCGKICKVSCYLCQNLHQREDEAIQLTRSKHHAHPCEKPLHCGHQCKENCTQNHQHTTVCAQKCRQVCDHARCDLPCSTPCAPCQEPCTWICEHFTCPVPCGSICVRLPCDRPCQRKLPCGHNCPSVCGETCDIQVCPECAPAHKQDQIVDFILSRTLSEVMPDQGALDDLLITIPSCRHVFTVETLDGHTRINNFYSRNKEDTHWTGLQTPIDTMQPPTCPTCRAPITCNRYGRIIKRAYLDILERNVASQMFRMLDKCQTVARNFEYDEVQAKLLGNASRTNFPKVKKMPSLKKQKAARASVLRNGKQIPVSETHIRPENHKLHSIDSDLITVWHVLDPLFKCYKEVVRIAETRSAHTQAWESAFSFLYQREIQAGLDQPPKMPRRPEEHAMRMAKIQVGQPRPLADKRLLVEAFWETIHIRLTIIQLAQAWLQEAGIDRDLPVFHRQQWAQYIDFMLHTCAVDAEKALKVAEGSNSHRQKVKSILLTMRISLEIFRFNVDMNKRVGTFKAPSERERLRQKAAGRYQDEGARMGEVVAAYLSREEVKGSEEEASWIRVHFAVPANFIVNEWSEMEKAIRLDTFYQPVSLEDKMGVIRAFNFGSTGHFYTCQNGHIFVITECGGAMERSKCPECGVVIGGDNHHLDSSNHVADEFDELSRQVNASIRQSPWANPY